MTPADLPYNRSLADLEALLATVDRPGDFHAHGALPLPLPVIEVEGVGPLSFPLPPAQATALIGKARQAPYGRGTETLVDTRVRRVWQIDAARVRIGGRSWAGTLRQVLAAVARGLGCEGAPITADLYKLLVYDAGSFFLTHRDSEKAPRMFGTLLLHLPSAHEGGDLLVRQGRREVRIELSGVDASELGFAAFYADCEHEVRPVTAGHRVCLVFNLLRADAQASPPPTAPDHEVATTQAAALLRRAFAPDDAPAKLVWLLQHQYSQAELGWSALKGLDAARAEVLRRAGHAAGCAAHLAILNIEESGPAQVEYAPRPRGRWHHGEDDDLDADTTDYDPIEVSSWNYSLDHWAAAGDGPPASFGRVPLQDAEVLPAGALDDERPDEELLLEATGNEGVSFERAWRRAALVLWPARRQFQVLLQAGLEPAVAGLERLLDTGAEAAEAQQAAQCLVDQWAKRSASWPGRRQNAPYERMLRALGRLGPGMAGHRFLQEVLPPAYDGSENAALAAALPVLLPPGPREQWLRSLAQQCFARAPRALCELLFLLAGAPAAVATTPDLAAVRAFAHELLARLPVLAARPTREQVGWGVPYEDCAADATSCHLLLTALERLGDPALLTAGVAAMAATPQVFDAARVLVPALQTLCATGGLQAGPHRVELWRHCSAALLARSEHPPAPPRDWALPGTLGCRCEDCRTLQAFAIDPMRREHRFRVRQDRRDHLESQIRQHGLDIDSRTENTGSPKTLVCRKTRAGYRSRCQLHAADAAAMGALLALAGEAPAAGFAAAGARLAAAAARRPEPTGE